MPVARSLLDVIIIGRDEAENLPRCLASVKAAVSYLEEQRGGGCSVLYVDSGSVDGSPSIAEAFGIRVATAPPGYDTPANGRTTGFLLTDSPYVMFLDADMEVAASWFVEAVTYLERYPETAGVAGLRDDVRPSGRGYRRIRNYYASPPRVVEATRAVGGAFMYRRAALSQIGGFDPRCIEEELLASLCLADRGWRLERLPVPMIVHWDTKLSRLWPTLARHCLGPSTAVGPFIRHALGHTRQWCRIYQYYRCHVVHAVFMAALVLLGVGGSVTGVPARATLATALAVTGLYWVLLVRQKGDTVRATVALPLLTVQVLSIVTFGLFNYPRIVYGTQHSDRYKRQVRAVNQSILTSSSATVGYAVPHAR